MQIMICSVCAFNRFLKGMQSMTRIGYVGLGLMGSAMARNLMKAGYGLVVHNRSQGIVQELMAAGAVAAGSPKTVAGQMDVIVTNLPDSADVEQVVLGPE